MENYLLKNILYVATENRKERIINPEIIKESVKTHSKNDPQTIKDHSTSVDIKTIQNYLRSTGT